MKVIGHSVRFLAAFLFVFTNTTTATAQEDTYQNFDPQVFHEFSGTGQNQADFNKLLSELERHTDRLRDIRLRQETERHADSFTAAAETWWKMSRQLDEELKAVGIQARKDAKLRRGIAFLRLVSAAASFGDAIKSEFAVPDMVQAVATGTEEVQDTTIELIGKDGATRIVSITAISPDQNSSDAENFASQLNADLPSGTRCNADSGTCRAPAALETVVDVASLAVGIDEMFDAYKHGSDVSTAEKALITAGVVVDAVAVAVPFLPGGASAIIKAIRIPSKVIDKFPSRFTAKLVPGEEGIGTKLLRSSSKVTDKVPPLSTAKFNNRHTLNSGGVIYSDPKNPGNSVRVMFGDPTSKFPNSQKPYVRVQKNGRPVDVNGDFLKTKKSSAAHPPLEDFVENFPNDFW